MTDAELIDRIEDVRANNNRHWMDLVRLAVRLDPGKAKLLLRQIAECDGEVRRLTKELAR